MSCTIRRRPEVSQDVVGLAEYIARDSVDAALRFFESVELTLQGLAEMPGKGALRDAERPRLAELRSYSVDGFPNHLIFYVPADDGILVLAVLHGARNLPAALRARY